MAVPPLFTNEGVNVRKKTNWCSGTTIGMPFSGRRVCAYGRGSVGDRCGKGASVWNGQNVGAAMGKLSIQKAKTGKKRSDTIIPRWQYHFSFRSVQSSSVGPSQVLSWETRQKRMVLYSNFFFLGHKLHHCVGPRGHAPLLPKEPAACCTLTPPPRLVRCK